MANTLLEIIFKWSARIVLLPEIAPHTNPEDEDLLIFPELKEESGIPFLSVPGEKCHG